MNGFTYVAVLSVHAATYVITDPIFMQFSKSVCNEMFAVNGAHFYEHHCELKNSSFSC